jgi:tripartite-type tricarboxylate transporter receptor subunit TctC
VPYTPGSPNDVMARLLAEQLQGKLTMKELGLDALSLEFWAGMWAPAGVPAEIVERLNAAINEVLQSPAIMTSMKNLGFESRIGSSQDFTGFVAAEIPRWREVVKASGVKSQ